MIGVIELFLTHRSLGLEARKNPLTGADVVEGGLVISWLLPA